MKIRDVSGNVQGVDVGGAGDQGMMFGYACRETYRLLPKAMVMLQEFSKWYNSLYLDNSSKLGADGKAQITGVYDKFWRLVGIDTFLVSYQNEETKEVRDEFDALIEAEINKLCEEFKVAPLGSAFWPTRSKSISIFRVIRTWPSALGACWGSGSARTSMFPILVRVSVSFGGVGTSRWAVS